MYITKLCPSAFDLIYMQMIDLILLMFTHILELYNPWNTSSYNSYFLLVLVWKTSLSLFQLLKLQSAVANFSFAAMHGCCPCPWGCWAPFLLVSYLMPAGPVVTMLEVLPRWQAWVIISVNELMSLMLLATLNINLSYTLLVPLL